MATKTVNFAQAFGLNLGGGIPIIKFAAGVQDIDESLLDHPYVRANLVGATKALAIPGMPEFLAEDVKRAEELKQMLEIAEKTANQLQQLRDKATKEGMRQLQLAARQTTPLNEQAAAQALAEERLRKAVLENPSITQSRPVQGFTPPEDAGEGEEGDNTQSSGDTFQDGDKSGDNGDKKAGKPSIGGGRPKVKA